MATTMRSTGRRRRAQSARGARRSPFFDALKARGAVYGSKAGWERPLWFDTGEVAGIGDAELRRQGPAGSTRSGASTRQRARAAAIFDQTSFSKFEVDRVSGAFAALQQDRGQRSRPVRRHLRLHAALQRARRHRGRPHHHAACRGPHLYNHRVPAASSASAIRPGSGGICPAAARSRSATSPRRTPCSTSSAPRRSRDVLQAATDDDLSNGAFPFSPSGRSRSGSRRCARRESAMWASSDGSCTFHSSRRRTSTSRGLTQERCTLRPRRRRLPGDQIAEAREGLRLLVGRGDAGHQPIRSRARLRGGVEQRGLHRPRRT